MIELTNKANVTQGREEVDGDSCCDQGGAEPQGEPGRGGGLGSLEELELLYEQAEAGNDKSEPHEGEAGADPGEKCALGGKVVAHIGFWVCVHRILPSNDTRNSR